MSAEKEVNQRAAAVVMTVIGYAVLIFALLLKLGEVPDARRDRPSESDNAQIRKAVYQGVQQSRSVIRSTVKELVDGVSCDEVQVGDSVTLRLNANRDFYIPGKYLLADSREVLILARGMVDVYNSFGAVKSKEFKITMEALGTADAIPVEGGIDYEGRSMSCFAAGRTIILEPGSKKLDNELLACARAASLAQYLRDRMPIYIMLKGREHGQMGGLYRSVDVQILFKGLLRYSPDATFCEPGESNHQEQLLSQIP